MDPNETKTFTDIRVADIALFSTVIAIWIINLFMMCFKRRLHNKLITVVLYGIIGVIIIARLVEVITLTMYDQ